MKQHKLLKRVFAVLFAGALMLGSVDSSAFQVNAEGAVTNVTFTATAMEEINQSGETALTTVKSGQPFFLAVKYTFSSPGDGYSYAGGTLQIQLPDKAVIDEAATSELFSSHATIFSSWKQDGQYLYFYTPDNQTISAGASGTLYIKLSYQNMETPNGYGAAVKEQFRNMEFTGTLLNSSGQSVPMDKILIDPLSVVNQADQTWSIYKSVVKNGTSDYTETDQYFNVEYGLEVSAGDGKNAVYDRFGRLSCNVFEFTDTLPALTAGVIENGKVIGYPKGGGVQKVLIVANKNDENQKTLVEGKDYTLEYEADGTTIKAVHFQYINQSGGNAIPDKTPINTTYSIVASYPKAAYEIAGNESSFSKYHLVNNASLEYQPLGKALQKVEANAPVDLGWVDLLAKHYDFTIKKQVQISAGLDGIEDVQDFDKDLQDIYYAYSGAKKVMFGLYKNKECTQVAVNFDGTVDVGKPQAVDKFGMISFEGLLAGKYYLKETSTIDGFQALDVKEVIISKNGEITVDGKKMNGAYKAVNKTDKDGFGYVAFWKKGNNAGGVSGYLPNIEFTLTSNTDSSIQYHAVSNTSGMVLFTGVKAGTYTLKEVDKGDGEFEKLSDEYEVEVIGNQVNYPYIKNTKDSLKKDENNHPYILNISKKGSIKIIKQDAATKEYLKGSAFVAYGPYRDQPDLTKFTIPSDKTLIHEISSEFTDGSKYFALDNGYYVLQEKQAPSNYVLDSSFTNVFIEQGKTTVVPFENTEAGALQIKKTGAMSASLDFKVPLAGAEFTVYTDAEATVIAKDINKQDAVLTTVMSQGEAVSNLVKLKPGTYYLKETKTPFGYKSDPTITAVEITSGVKTSSVPRYVFAHDAISVSEINNLSIYKEAKGQSDKEYKGSGQAATTVPNGSMDYRIVVKNGSTSTNKVTKARVLDILPFAGDTLVNRSNLNGTPTDRGTSIVKRPILKKDGVKVYDHDGIEIPSQYVTIYYCVDPIETWTAANRSAAQRELDLPMIYGTMESGAWTSGNRNWVTDLSGYTMDQVTAIGAEVDFQAMKLAEGSDFTIHIGMTAPNFTTDEIDDITDKFYFNSAMCAVLRDGHDAGEAISDDNRTENDPVKMKVNLPKGSIGDYAFVDRNNDGLQDAGDVALSGVGVTLYTYRKGIDDAVPVLIGTKKTTTDQSGYYLFDNLDCNNPLEGRSKDSDDPNDFVGKVIYSYKLEFESPVDESVYSYKPTLQYAGSKAYPAADSNIDSDGLTDFVRLTVTKEADGNLLGEDDPTIDAGFVSLGALGDYVWIDDNRNGIQDADEKGIEGVTVNLLEKKDGILRYKKSVTTDKDGFYIFKELPAGEYVVEFDITSVSSTGYSRYEFTKYVDDVNAADVNSDAKNMVPATDDQVARTDVIKLEDRGIDMSIDAGLTYYSALSGRTFEDRNFDDLNNNAAADIPLLKTKVELYRVVSGIREKDPYMSQPVKDDGTYLFDKLLPGTYQVRFIFPQGYDIVKGNIGFDDTIDSDITYVEDSRESGFTDVITVKGNSIEKYWDGGARRYSSLGDYVWNDSNKDGLQDLDEQPIANVRVYLQRQAPGEDFWTVQSETMTDKYGRYRFDHLEGSTYTGIKYRIFFDLSPFTQLTIPRNGDTELDSNALPTYMAGWGFPTDIIKLGYASEDMSWDAGIIETSGSIGDYVWFDTNRNGIQDEAGTGIGNVLVVLERSEDENLNDSSWVKVGETYTNASGYYRFDGLAEGYYRVKFYLPNSYVTTPNQGTDIERDSDGIRRIQDWSVTRPFYLSEGGYDMSWDCGIYDGNPSIKTGDTTNTQLYIMLMMFSMGSVVYLWRRRKMI